MHSFANQSKSDDKEDEKLLEGDEGLKRHDRYAKG